MRHQILAAVPTDYKSQLEDLVQFLEAGDDLSSIGQQFGNFTAHDLGHFEQVAKTAITLGKAADLHPEEWFCLVSACYLHDMGMAHGAAQHNHGLRSQEAIRKSHSILSRTYVQDQVPPQCIRSPDHRDAIAYVCWGHGLWDWSSSAFDDRGPIRMRLLAAILSLADALDLRPQRRIPAKFRNAEELLEYKGLDVPSIKEDDLGGVSRVHWLRHYYSRPPIVNVKPGLVKIRLSARIGTTEDRRPDPRRALVEEIISSGVESVLEWKMFQQASEPHFAVRLESPSEEESEWPSMVSSDSDPALFIFPEQLVDDAVRGGLVRPRTINLQSGVDYYATRIEPFLAPSDVQLSVSWRPSSLAPETTAKHVMQRNARLRIRELAERTWDIVLWPTKPYVDLLVAHARSGKHAKIDARVAELEEALRKIRDGRLKKIFIAVRDAVPDPTTATDKAVKVGQYTGTAGERKITGGRIEIANRQVESAFQVRLEDTAYHLGVSTEVSVERLRLLCRADTAFLMSAATMETVLESAGTRVAHEASPFSISIFVNAAKRIRDTVNTAEIRSILSALRNPQRVQFLPMTEEHLERVRVVEQDGTDWPWSVATFRRVIAEDRGFVCMKRSAVIGYVAIREQEGALLIAKMAVHPLARRRGLGDRILDFVRMKALEKGMDSLLLHVRASNEGARTLYTRKGFEIEDILDGYYKKTGQTELERRAIKMRRSVHVP